jgi:hypothetical protein
VNELPIPAANQLAWLLRIHDSQTRPREKELCWPGYLLTPEQTALISFALESREQAAPGNKLPRHRCLQPYQKKDLGILWIPPNPTRETMLLTLPRRANESNMNQQTAIRTRGPLAKFIRIEEKGRIGGSKYGDLNLDRRCKSEKVPWICGEQAWVCSSSVYMKWPSEQLAYRRMAHSRRGR